VLIGLAVVLMAAFVSVAGSSLGADRDATVTTVAEPNAQRTLAVYYARRAFPGAPPVIPHPVFDALAEGKACLPCHAQGGWAPIFGGYAPVVPHPDLQSCWQCHVPQTANSVFRPTAWSTATPPKIGRVAAPGSPPPIPHKLQMRENCLACHSGPGAVAEIRTSHPERANCRECHTAGH
jgi:nitrate reductase (cytochrome), electron transfer subunit